MQGGNNPFSALPPVTRNIIVINALLWIASALMSARLDMTAMFGLHYPASPAFKLYQIVTYMFMHANFAHVFFNMFAVYMFGAVLEMRVWGSRRFLTYYLVTGVGAALINLLVVYLRVSSIEAQLSPELVEMVRVEGAGVIADGKNYTNHLLGSLNVLLNAPTVGASGAVFGILLAFGMLFPNVEMYIMFIPVPVKAKYMVAGYGVIELFAGIANFSFDNVAHFAHLGGMLFGIILVLLWKKKNNSYGNSFY